MLPILQGVPFAQHLLQAITSRRTFLGALSLLQVLVHPPQAGNFIVVSPPDRAGAPTRPRPAATTTQRPTRGEVNLKKSSTKERPGLNANFTMKVISLSLHN